MFKENPNLEITSLLENRAKMVLKEEISSGESGGNEMVEDCLCSLYLRWPEGGRCNGDTRGVTGRIS